VLAQSEAFYYNRRTIFQAMSSDVDHIDYALSAKRHTPMYLMYKYWARKPHNVVGKYIERYSEENEIVLDPFCGSGVTFLEALKLNRKTIAIDLDPVATFITRMTALYVDLEEYKLSFKNIEKIKEDVESLFLTKCTECGEYTPFHYIVMDNETPQMIHYRCHICNNLVDKPFDEEDAKRTKDIEEMEIPYWYPTNELIWNSRVNVHQEMKVTDLFSKRNLIALSIILNEIEKINGAEIKNMMKFTFSSMLPQASKLLVYTEGSGPSWKVRGYWIPKKRWEMNVWRFFENSYKKMLRGKKESNKLVGNIFKENENAWIYNQSATDLSNIEDSSIDYVFTDPPYGDSVPYLELNYIYSSWLKFDVNFQEEIIISDSPIRKEKQFDEYNRLLTRSFREIYRVLKDEKYMTLTFHNTDIKIYNAIIKAVIFAGFDLEKIVYQPPATVSAKAQLAPYGSAKGDYYIRLKKTNKETLGLAAYSEIDERRYELIIVEAVKKLIAEHGEPITYSTIVNNYTIIYEELKKNGYLFSAPESIEDILKKHINTDFDLIDIKNNNGKTIGKKWWVKGIQFLDRVPLTERVEAVTVNILNRHIKVSYDDVLRQVYLIFTNAHTPDTQNVKEVLEEYAEKTPDGQWRLKPVIRQRESEHDSLVELLAILGIKIGYEVYADIPEYRHELEFDIPPENIARIQEIDVIWYRGNEITHEFEVENTTGITEAIVRGSNILDPNTKRYIVLPEERESFFKKKIAEPMIKEKIEEHNWHFIFYDTLKTFFDKNKSKEHLELSEFENIAGKPTQLQQQNMHKFFETEK